MYYQATRVNAAEPNHYYAKNFTPVNVTEMKAFFRHRLAIEMLIHKDRYEQYWQEKDDFLTVTASFSEVFTWNRFLVIWSLLHSVKEDEPNVNEIKIYKSRPMFDYWQWKFERYDIPEHDLSLDKEMIPTKKLLVHKTS